MTDVTGYLDRAQAMVQLRRYDEAAGLLAQAVASEPENSRAWCLLARAHLGAGRYADAANAANQAVAAAPSYEWPHRLASIAQRGMGNAGDAVRAAHEACRLEPNEWRAWVCLAQASLYAKDYATAEHAAASARGLAPDEADVHYVSGQVSFARGQWDQARMHEERALAINPEHSSALNELGRISLKQRNASRAADYFIRAVQHSPSSDIFAHNVYIAVRSVITRVVYFTTIAIWVLLVSTLHSDGVRSVAVPGLCVIGLSSAAFAAWRLRALPPATRPLLRTTHVLLAFGVVYGCLVLAIVVAAVVPARGLPGALLGIGALIFASRFIANAILRSRHR